MGNIVAISDTNKLEAIIRNLVAGKNIPLDDLDLKLLDGELDSGYSGAFLSVGYGDQLFGTIVVSEELRDHLLAIKYREEHD